LNCAVRNVGSLLYSVTEFCQQSAIKHSFTRQRRIFSPLL
jgi:hypothetical protein